MSTHTITLRKEDGLWLADMTHAEGAQDIYRMFGTYLLPTPYRAIYPARDAQEAIALKNPRHRVTVEE